MDQQWRFNQAGRLALAAGIWMALSSVVLAQQPGDIKVVVAKAEKSITKGASDVLLVNNTKLPIPVELGSKTISLPIGQELALKVDRGLDPLSITEYRWGIRGKPGKSTMGWIPRKTTTYVSRLGVRGAPKKHSITRPDD